MNKNHNDSQISICVAMATQIVEQLSAMYEMLDTENSADDFGRMIFTPMMESQPDPNEIEDKFEDGDVSNLDMLRLSCAYAVGAFAADASDDYDNAWLAVSHAQYWMGVAFGLGFMKGAKKAALSDRAKAASDKRNAVYHDLKSYARKLALEGYPETNRPYPSRRQAALGIRDRVVAKSQSSIKLKPDNAERTITKWLADLTFPPKP